MDFTAPDPANAARPEHLDPATFAFYRACMLALGEAKCDYLVGGAYAFARYTGIERHTKDFDIFCRQRDVDPILAVLDRLGCQTEKTFPHWLAKAYNPGTADFIDVIYSSGSGIAVVDDEWFTHSVPETVLGVPVRLCPAEEIIWSKGFIMERERYDGNDVAHLIRARGTELDWDRLLRRFGPHWRVLLSHLVLFGFIYPAERGQVPRSVQDDLVRRLQAETAAAEEPAAAAPADKTCRGTLISRAQYLVDIGPWGYRDARLEPGIKMTPADIAHWTRAIDEDKKETKPRS
ncbi:MAG TPA: hypothetical protein VFK70_12315 [Vicinamibacteria bacterium]|nr:hypothetical protein [Vicinamibacteria bacterium]